MARTYPRHVAETTVSDAERRFFGLLRDQLTDEWTVLHSLGLTVHSQKPWAEIDFVLIGPPGVFCLEVKGGRVSRVGGMWRFTDRHDRTNEKTEGPFAQAASAAAALRHYLVGRYRRLGGVPIGYGVVLPDVIFNEQGPDIEPAVLYDLRDRSQDVSRYVERLSDYWLERLSSQHGRRVRTLSEMDRAAITDELRGDFDLRPSLRSRIVSAEEELLRLTKEQYRILDGLSENARVIVRGGAGTGKTLLAVEESLRLAAAGMPVLLCCFNRQLALFLREVIAGERNPLVEVYHLHGLMAKLVSDAGLEGRLPAADDADLFAVFYPEVCLEALLALDRLESYEALVVDEGQDLLMSAYFDVLDALLKGGLKGGQWRVFFDPYQDLFRPVDSSAVARILQDQPAQFRLMVNCRNTLPIGIATSILSGVRCDETLIVDGPEVEQHWYSGPADQRRLVSRSVNRLLSVGIKPQEICILSKYRFSNSCLGQGPLDVDASVVDISDRSAAPGSHELRFSTVGAFKGLESKVIVLADIDDLCRPDSLSSLYVGASRARTFLALFIDQRVRDEYSERAREYGEALAAAPSDRP
jgi:hypothetical protein